MAAVTRSNGTWCLFAKPPEPGRSKTRLAKDIGDARATKLATGFLSDTINTLRAVTGPSESLVLATTQVDGVFPAAAAGLPRWSQGTGDLGARMASVLQTALDSAPWAVAVGADSPGAPQRLYDAARDTLETGAEAVIGPALDGGFYLLGLRRCPEGLFSDLSWSQATTCAEMIERLVAFGMAPVVIDPWYDVDEVEDLARLQRHLALGIVAAPETATVLASEPAPETAGVSVVVPVYNESARIAQTLADLAAVPGIAEVVIVDGQSTDATVNIVRVAAKGLACPVRVVIGRQGRARQQNGGAALAQHETLLFLHADVRLPTDAIAQVDATLGDPSVVAGAFKTWTVPDADAPRSLLAPFWHVADVRSRVTQFPYGDQAIFTRRATFDAVGGFPDLVLMEDLAFSQRLALLGTIALVDARVTVSARRMTHNWPLHMLMWNTFPTLFRLGVAPETLARWYRHVR